MDKIYDFSGDRLVNRPLGGTDRKNPVEHDGVVYMLKYTEDHTKKGDMSTSHLNSITSEYISSHISESVGLPTHHTLLGYRDGETVVACKDFRKTYESNIEFGEYVRSVYTEKEIGRALRLDQIYGTIEKASNIPQELKQPSIERYWDTFVVDALVGNFDRHKGNWGYIAGPDDSLRLAPVYDYGSTLLPMLSDSGIKDIINNRYEMAARCLIFPSPALFIGKEKTGKPGYYDLLSSGYDENCTKSLLKIAPKIDVQKINDIIDSTPLISDIKREFYKKYIALRKELVIDRAFELCVNKDFDLDALKRVKIGKQLSVDELYHKINKGEISFDFDDNTQLHNKLIVIAGIPGAGKDNKAQEYLYSAPGSAYIRTNNIREELTSAYNNDFTNDDVLNIAYTRIKDALKDAKDVVYVATNLDTESRKKVLNLVKNEAEIKKTLVVLYRDPHIPVQDFTSERLCNMARKLQENPPSKDEGWDIIEVIGDIPKLKLEKIRHNEEYDISEG